MNALGTSIIVAGEVMDPEGEAVTLAWRLCGASSSDVRVDGMTWEADVRTIACEQQGVDVYEITVTAEDASGNIEPHLRRGRCGKRPGTRPRCP